MARWWSTVFRLGVKELRGLLADPVMLFMILYIFTIAVYAVANGAKFEVSQAAVAVVDEDRSPVSRQVAAALLPPTFRLAVEIDAHAVDSVLEAGHFVFVLQIPPRFERDLLQGRQPAVQLDVDATAMSQAGNGAAYIQSIVMNEVQMAMRGRVPAQPSVPIGFVTRVRFNPNLVSEWFTSVMQVINAVTMLSVILTGAALIREREHGTIEHLLVMPVSPAQIMLAKIWSNGLVILVASAVSITVVVHLLLSVPLVGSVPLFLAGVALYLFSTTALGIVLGTYSGSMAQFGLLVMPVLVVMNLLSGSSTPLESMPAWLQNVMQLSPSTHFVSFSQAVLYRGAEATAVTRDILALIAIGTVLFAIALLRFRRALAAYQ